MARLDEIAEGIATVLNLSRTPEPLGVDLVGQSPAEVTFLVRAIVDACERRAAPLVCIRVATDYASNLNRTLGPAPLQYQGIQIELSADLDHRIELHRFPISHPR
jgi:hypothetical protein